MSSFTSRSGICNYRGPPSWSDIYARHVCFETAYTPNSENLNCQSLVTQGVQACYYNSECQDGECYQGQCWSSKIPGNPLAYQSNNPRIVKEMQWKELEQFARAAGIQPAFDSYTKAFAAGDRMYLVQVGAKQVIATPLNVVYFNQQPNLGNCLKTIWQCDRYRDPSQNPTSNAQTLALNQVLHNQCKQCEECFLYDVADQQGHLIDIMVVMSPFCQGVTKAALQKCSLQCGTAIPYDALALQ